MVGCGPRPPPAPPRAMEDPPRAPLGAPRPYTFSQHGEDLEALLHVLCLPYCCRILKSSWRER